MGASEMRSGRWPIALVLLFGAVVVGLVFSLHYLKPGEVGFFLSVLSVLFAAVSSLGAWFTVREMQVDRAERSRPWIVVDFPSTRTGAIYCQVRNMGPGLARDVAVRFHPEPVDHRGQKLTDLPIFQRPIPIMAPGAKIRQFFHVGDELLKMDIPRQFQVTVSYEGEAGFREKGEAYSIDLEQYRHQTLPPATVEEHLEQLGRQLQKMVDVLERASTRDTLKVEAPDQDQAGLPRRLDEGKPASEGDAESVDEAADP